MAGPRRLAFTVLIIAAAGMLAHFSSLSYGFVFDEKPLIIQNPAAHDPTDLGRIFGTKFWPGPARGIYYRPIVTLSYAIGYAWRGPSPMIQHWFNLLFHGVACALLFLLARRLGGRDDVAAVAGLIFAVHPVHVESVAWVPGRTDVLAALFLAAAWLALLRGRESARRPLWLAAAALLFLVALGAKEVAIMLPALLLVFDLRGKAGRRAIADYATILVAAVVYFIVRSRVLSGGGPDPAPHALAGLSALNAWAARAALPALAAARILLPWPWRIDYAYNWVPGSGLVWPLAAAAVAGAAATAWGLWRKRAWAQAPACFFLSLAPTMHLVPFPNYFAERFLYLPSFFLLLFLAERCAPILDRRPGLTQVLATAMAAILLLLSGLYGAPFQDDLSFWRAAVRQVPELAIAHNWLGIAYRDRREWGRAEEHYLRALTLDPGLTVARMNEAEVLLQKGEKERAARVLEELAAQDPNNADLLYNLALAWFQTGDLRRAGENARAVLRLAPDHQPARKLLMKIEGN